MVGVVVVVVLVVVVAVAVAVVVEVRVVKLVKLFKLVKLISVYFFDIFTSKKAQNPFILIFYTFDLEMCFAPQRRALFQHLNFQKWSEPECVLYILTWKCASRHNGVHFFDISTSKSGPNLVCFVHFDLEMCFAPQRRAIFHRSCGQLAPHPPL